MLNALVNESYQYLSHLETQGQLVELLKVNLGFSQQVRCRLY